MNRDLYPAVLHTQAIPMLHVPMLSTPIEESDELHKDLGAHNFG